MNVGPEIADILVIEPNPVVARRAARVLSAAASMATYAVIEEVEELARAGFSRARLVACNAELWPRASDWQANTAPKAHVMLWTQDNDRALIESCAKRTRVGAIVGWPRFLSTPRLWEVGQFARRAMVAKSVPTVEQLLEWGSTTRVWSPADSVEIEPIVSEVRALAESSSPHPRVADRVGECAYELLMNAVYDAPSLADGTPRYAMDRTQHVQLEDWERPTLQLATDGVRLALSATDPFGGLQRWHVFESIARGLSASATEDGAGVVDSSRGGAGLGFFKMFSGASTLLVTVDRGRATEVTLFWDLDVHPRDLRAAPSSVHFWNV
jgi:hypothetical protein